MSVEWSDDLVTGVREIDAQHRDLFAHINKLLDACKENRGKEEVGDMLRFLETYVYNHFSLEERAMVRYQYPGIDEHKAQHAEFLSELQKLKRKYIAEGATINTLVVTNHAVVYWLATHIRNIDKKLATFLREKSAVLE